MRSVALVNASTKITDAEVQAFMAAAQIQVSRDFAPAWDVDAHLYFVPAGSKPKPTDYVLAFLDNADVAGALGYHDVTASGQPLGKVFVETTMKAGMDWNVTASHELLEMLGDPTIDLTVFDASGAHTGMLYAREACDPVEADADGYPIDGIRVSNFVLPAYFDPLLKAAKFDFMGRLTKPLEIRPQGYQSAMDIKRDTGWVQLSADASASRGRQGYDGSRRHRRNKGRQNFVASTAV